MTRPITVPVKAGPRGYLAKAATTQQEIRESLNQIIFVSPGERFMRNDIGVPLYQYVFDPVDEVFEAGVETFVRAQVARFETRVSVENIRASRVERADGAFEVTLQIAYKIPAFDRADTAQLSEVFTRAAG